MRINAAMIEPVVVSNLRSCADQDYSVITTRDECQKAAEILGLVQEQVPDEEHFQEKVKDKLDNVAKLKKMTTRLPHCAYTTELPYFTFDFDFVQLNAFNKCGAKNYSCVCKKGAHVHIPIYPLSPLIPLCYPLRISVMLLQHLLNAILSLNRAQGCECQLRASQRRGSVGTQTCR